MVNIIKLMVIGQQRLEEREVQVLNIPTVDDYQVDEQFYTLRQELEAMIAPPAPRPTTKIDRIRAGAISNLRRLLDNTLSGDYPERKLSLGQIHTIGQLVQKDDVSRL
jgi:hypothetical protein